MESQYYTKRRQGRKFSVSPRLAALTDEFLKGGGIFKKIRIGTLALGYNGDTDIQGSHINGRGTIVVSSGLQNNGVIGQSDFHAKVFEPNAITVDMFGNVFYRDTPFKMVTHARVFALYFYDKRLTDDCLLYIASTMSYLSKVFSYSNMASYEKIKELTVILPIKDEVIDFSFMRRYIATLKAERVATLKAYLQATGLADTQLTEEEKEAIKRERQKNVMYETFKIEGKTGVFNVNNTHSILKSEVVPGSGTTPYVGAGENDNSVQCYISYKDELIERGNSIMIGGKTLVVTYQEEDYYSNDSHNLALYYRECDKLSRNQFLFLVTTLYKSLKPVYSWGDSISKAKIKKDCLALPITSTGAIDYAFMEAYISAQTKLCIRSLMSSKDMEITATENLIK